MRDYPVYYPAAFLVDEEVVKCLKAKSVEEAYEFLQQYEGVDDTQLISGFTGSATYLNTELKPVMKNGVSESEEYDDDYIAYLPLDRDADLLKPAFGSFEEVIEEFKSKLSGILPDDFNYAAHIASISGTMFG